VAYAFVQDVGSEKPRKTRGAVHSSGTAGCKGRNVLSIFRGEGPLGQSSSHLGTRHATQGRGDPNDGSVVRGEKNFGAEPTPLPQEKVIAEDAPCVFGAPAPASHARMGRIAKQWTRAGRRVDVWTRSSAAAVRGVFRALCRSFSCIDQAEAIVQA
jgi:hypothetical protein